MSIDALGTSHSALLSQTGLASGASGLPPAPGLATGGAQLRFEEALRVAGGPGQVSPANAPQAPAEIHALRTAQATGGVTATDAVPLTGPQAPAAAPPTDSAQAADRAARGLELPPQVGPGQSILDGLGRMRSIFDQQVSGVASAGQREVLDTATLMTLQSDVVRYTLLVDVTSKLAGKSTQALDTLMKGQ